MAQHAAVLGVNFGHVGFLADIGGDELAEALERVARGQALLDERTALVAQIGAEPARRFIAFNDVVVARLPGFGLARLRVVVAGESLLVLQGDGVVIASPTGSTAYTVGAGGPAVAPSLDAIVITPLASQGTPLRSLVVDGSEVVRVELEPSSAPLSIEIDGRETHAMPSPARSRSARPRARRGSCARARGPSTATWPPGCEPIRRGGCHPPRSRSVRSSSPSDVVQPSGRQAWPGTVLIAR